MIEKVSEADRLEQMNLEQVVSDLERRVLLAPMDGRALLNEFLSNAKAKLGSIEKRIREAEREQRASETNEVAMHALAERERALNAEEKHEFSGFLGKEFFTKADFSNLDGFYSKSWERLSYHGKEELSHRFWEGIRKGEYEFHDAPSSVREKETKMAYGTIAKQSDPLSNVSFIASSDRADFVRAYEAGHMAEAERVLERPGFKEQLFVVPPSPLNHAITFGIGRESEAASKLQPAPPAVQPPASGAGIASTDLAVSNLDGIKIAEVNGPPSPGNFPRGENALAKSR